MLTQQAVLITFRSLASSETLEADIRAHATKLDRLYPALTNCRVVVEAPHHRHHQCRLYHVRIVLHVPGHEIIVSHEQHDAFMAAAGQLEEHQRNPRDLGQRGAVHDQT